MMVLKTRVAPLILAELARGERRVLSLTVAVGKVMARTGSVKGSLESIVKSALRELLAAGQIIETGDGVFSLPRR